VDIFLFLVTNPRTTLSQAERTFVDLLEARVGGAPGGLFVYPEGYRRRPVGNGGVAPSRSGA
jgi:hypothetical protein